MKLIRNKMFTFVLLSIIQDYLYTFKMQMSKEKIDSINKNENNCKFYVIAYFSAGNNRRSMVTDRWNLIHDHPKSFYYDQDDH